MLPVTVLSANPAKQQPTQHRTTFFSVILKAILEFKDRSRKSSISLSIGLYLEVIGF